MKVRNRRSRGDVAHSQSCTHAAQESKSHQLRLRHNNHSDLLNEPLYGKSSPAEQQGEQSATPTKKSRKKKTTTQPSKRKACIGRVIDILAKGYYRSAYKSAHIEFSILHKIVVTNWLAGEYRGYLNQQMTKACIGRVIDILAKGYYRSACKNAHIEFSILYKFVVTNWLAGEHRGYLNQQMTKIFVYGLGFDVTRYTLLSAFQPYGEIDDCNVVTDRQTGNCKGYAFVVFKNRKGAVKALKEPRKKIGNRFASCQLASTGPNSPVAGSVQQDLSSRKIYVSNVSQDADAKRLRDFFAKFGEIECGPFGIDPHTGKWKGYALFVYKTAEEAKKCLEEPYKMFEGRQLHCEKAAEGKSGGKFGGGAAGITTAVVQQPFQPLQAGPEVLNAIAAAQNLAMLGSNPSAALLNPFYSGFLGNPNLGMLNPVLGMGQVGQVSGPEMTAAGYGTLIGGSGSNNLMLGTYGSGGSSGGMPRGLMHAYPNLLAGQTSASAKAPENNGYSSQLWVQSAPNVDAWGTEECNSNKDELKSRAFLENLQHEEGGFVTFGDVKKGHIIGKGQPIVSELSSLNEVLLARGLRANVISVSQLIV
nr:UBP1-associated protein 2B-like [Ipomoea batatas]